MMTVTSKTLKSKSINICVSATFLEFRKQLRQENKHNSVFVASRVRVLTRIQKGFIPSEAHASLPVEHWLSQCLAVTTCSIVYLSVHSASCKHCAMKCISIARVRISRIAHSLCIRQYLPCIRRRSKCLWHSMGMACKNRCRRRSLKISYRREIVIKCIYSREQSLSCFLELDISQLIGLFKFCLST